MMHLVRFDVSDAGATAFHRWYREEHLPAVLAEPGWEAAHTYEALEGEPKTLVIFDLATDVVPEGQIAASPLVTYPSDHHLRNYDGETLRAIASTGADPRDAELMNLIVVEVAPEYAERFNDWYDEVHVPEILACPGWEGNQRYVSVERPGRFLSMYGLSDAELPFNSPEFREAVGWDEHVGWIRNYHGFRIYQRTGRVEKPLVDFEVSN